MTSHISSQMYITCQNLKPIQEKGLAVLIQNDTCKIFHSDRGLLFHTSMKGNRMFYLTSTMNPQCLLVSDGAEQKAQLWHKRFAHLNFQGLCTLANKHLVIDLPPL